MLPPFLFLNMKNSQAATNARTMRNIMLPIPVGVLAKVVRPLIGPPTGPADDIEVELAVGPAGEVVEVVVEVVP